MREDTGAVWLSTRNGEFQARINCDSLLMRGTLSAQHERSCAAHISGFPVGQWYTLRYRFVEGYVIGEAQRADGSWRPVQIMLAPSPPTSVIIGKAADLNRDIDIGGKSRDCWVDQVAMF